MLQERNQSHSEIARLLELSSKEEKLERARLSVFVKKQQGLGEEETLTVEIVDIATRYRCSQVQVFLKNGVPTASKATIDNAYTGLASKQQALILGNIYYYSGEVDPLFQINFADTVDNESEQIREFGNFIRNRPPRMFRQLQNVLLT